MTDLKEQLQSVSKEVGTPKEPSKPILDKLGRSYATGKRKNAIARVWLKKGNGKIIVNSKSYTDYFKRSVLQMIVNQPFDIVNQKYDIVSTIRGGGLSGQAGALKHGISKAIAFFNPELRKMLKQSGFLTRDARIVERKKPGRPKARKSFQFSKR